MIFPIQTVCIFLGVTLAHLFVIGALVTSDHDEPVTRPAMETPLLTDRLPKDHGTDEEEVIEVRPDVSIPTEKPAVKRPLEPTIGRSLPNSPPEETVAVRYDPPAQKDAPAQQPPQTKPIRDLRTSPRS
ncbi:MAG: hypothetical protein KBF76_16885 [Verrucomicrobiales bacterium]|nr:hypothetical protein [Verrucomicrobiales bacterium]